MRRSALLLSLLFLPFLSASAEEMKIWPGTPPGEPERQGEEIDTTKPDSNKVAGRRVIRLGNVSNPTITVYRPENAPKKAPAVVICPGGGFSILAYDLEGTEVAEWLNEIGMVGVVLKYRVPTRERDSSWLAPVQDTQRAISLVRANADKWGVDPEKIGVLGFSAGGATAAATAVFENDRKYEVIDEVDQVSPRPDFAVLVYPAYLAGDALKLREHLTVRESAPPTFFVHAADDRVSARNSIGLFMALRELDVPAELHIYSTGGHGYGLRRTDEPITHWPDRCEDWLRNHALLPKN